MSRTLDTVLAALRLYQMSRPSNPELAEIAPNPLDNEEINELCENLNTVGITVEVRGGTVQDVAGLGLPVRVIDYDVDGIDAIGLDRDDDDLALFGESIGAFPEEADEVTEDDRQLVEQLLTIKTIDELQEGHHDDAVRGALANLGIENCIEPGDTPRQMFLRAMEMLVTADADCDHVEALLVKEVNAAIRRSQN